MTVRRIVAAKNTEGRSTIISDGPSPRERAMVHIPGMVTAALWSTGSSPEISPSPTDPMLHLTSLVPEVGGTQFMVVTLPPDTIFSSPSFNASKARAERFDVSPGLAEAFEPTNPGMHTTPTIDYGVVLEGEIWLELDDGEVIHLARHDTFVQHGVRHAWRNRSESPATFAVVLIGARASS